MCGLHAGALNVRVLTSGVVDPSEKQTKAKDTLPRAMRGAGTHYFIPGLSALVDLLRLP